MSDEKEILFKRFADALADRKRLREEHVNAKKRLDRMALEKESLMEINFLAMAVTNRNRANKMYDSRDMLASGIQEPTFSDAKRDIPPNLDDMIPWYFSSLEQPILFEEDDDIISIFNLGALPSPEDCDFHNSNYIYPIGYRVARSFRTAPGEPAELVTCEIGIAKGKIQFRIINDGKVWKGGFEVWKNFFELHKIQGIFTVEDFLGISLECVQGLIEKLGDVSIFNEYVPVEYR